MKMQAAVRVERQAKAECVGAGLYINLQRLRGLGIKLPSAVNNYSLDSRPLNPSLKTVLSLVNLRRCRLAEDAVELLNQALVAVAIGHDWPLQRVSLTKADELAAGYRYQLVVNDHFFTLSRHWTHLGREGIIVA